MHCCQMMATEISISIIYNEKHLSCLRAICIAHILEAKFSEVKVETSHFCRLEEIQFII